MKINFSYNWNNKLDCNYFTTLRLHQPHRYEIGAAVEIYHKNEFIGNGEIIQTKQLYKAQINEFIAGLDTGYSLQDTLLILDRMYPKVDWQKQQLELLLIRKL